MESELKFSSAIMQSVEWGVKEVSRVLLSYNHWLLEYVTATKWAALSECGLGENRDRTGCSDHINQPLPEALSIAATPEPRFPTVISEGQVDSCDEGVD